MSSDEDYLSVSSEIYPSTELDGNTCDSYSHRNSQDASVNHSGQLDEVKNNMCNNKLQQDTYYGKPIDEEKKISAINQENYSKEDLAAKDCKSTLARNISLGKTNYSKSCISVSHQDRQESCAISTYSM